VDGCGGFQREICPMLNANSCYTNIRPKTTTAPSVADKLVQNSGERLPGTCLCAMSVRPFEGYRTN
jgi:hypothetical protein